MFINEVAPDECLDLWHHNQKQEVIDNIIFHIVSNKTASQACCIKIPHFNQNIATRLKKCGLKHKELENRHYYIRYGESFIPKFSKENTYLSGFHGDYCMF